MYTVIHYCLIAVLLILRVPFDTFAWDLVRANQLLVFVAVLYVYIYDLGVVTDIAYEVTRAYIPQISPAEAVALQALVHVLPTFVLGFPRGLEACLAASAFFGTWYLVVRKHIHNIYFSVIYPPLTDNAVATALTMCITWGLFRLAI
jgi:hypothetical protein